MAPRKYAEPTREEMEEIKRQIKAENLMRWLVESPKTADVRTLRMPNVQIVFSRRMNGKLF